MGRTLQVKGMYRGHILQVRGIYKGRTLQVRGMYRGWTCNVREMYRGQIAFCKMKITLMDVTSHCLLSSSQEPLKCLFFEDFPYHCPTNIEIESKGKYCYTYQYDKSATYHLIMLIRFDISSILNQFFFEC